MKKRLLSLLTIVLSIFMLCSCGLVIKTPTSVVNDYIKDFKTNLDNDISNSIVSAIASTEDSEVINKVKESLKKSLSNIDVEVKDESIKDKSAAVTVDINGISISKVISDSLEKLQSADFINELSSLPSDKYSDKITDLILECVNNAEPESRICTFNLSKDGDSYKITNSNNELCNAIWGTDLIKINSLKH